MSSSGVRFGHYYDLTKTVSADFLDRADISYADVPVRVGCSDIV